MVAVVLEGQRLLEAFHQAPSVMGQRHHGTRHSRTDSLAAVAVQQQVARLHTALLVVHNIRHRHRRYHLHWWAEVHHDASLIALCTRWTEAAGKSKNSNVGVAASIKPRASRSYVQLRCRKPAYRSPDSL